MPRADDSLTTPPDDQLIEIPAASPITDLDLSGCRLDSKSEQNRPPIHVALRSTFGFGIPALQPVHRSRTNGS